MTFIVKTLNSDGSIGWDQLNQLWFKSGDTYYPIRDLVGKSCQICDQQWSVDSLPDQRFWYVMNDYVHKSCYFRYLSTRDHEFLYNSLLAAKFEFTDFERIPNRYDGSPRSWYDVNLSRSINGAIDKYTIRFGRRKRVWHLELIGHFDTRIVESLFDSDNVTKLSRQLEASDKPEWWQFPGSESQSGSKVVDCGSSFVIHAHTDNDVVLYLTRFRDVTGGR